MLGNYERVLVVDDCEFLRRRLKRELTGNGFSVELASDGVEALRLVEAQDFDFVITDWEMPNLDGDLLCRYLRNQHDSEKYIYIIMMTAHTDAVSVVGSFSAGVDDFVTKPLDFAELLARMKAGMRVLDRDRRMTSAAERDPLTGLLNRRSLETRLNIAMDSCAQFSRPLSCILLDLDRFKQLNDQYGHLAGDAALVRVAETLKLMFRANDHVFRYGGEEFLVILPDTTCESATQCAERCRRAVAEVSLASLGIQHGLTASFGVAESLAEDSSYISLLERTDAALLTAKQSGRNRTVVAGSTLEVPSLSTVGDGANDLQVVSRPG